MSQPVSQLILLTNVDVSNVQIDYTGASAQAIEAGRVIELMVGIPRNKLCTVDASDNVTSSLLVLKITAPFEENPTGVTEVGQNITNVLVNKAFAYDFASSLLQDLSGNVQVASGFAELGFLKSSNGSQTPIDATGLGIPVVRMLQHVLVKHFTGITAGETAADATDRVNNTLRAINTGSGSHSFIVDLLLNNENSIRTAVQSDLVGLSANNDQYVVSFGSKLDSALSSDASGLNIPTRFLKSIVAASQDGVIVGSEFTTAKLKEAVAHYMFSNKEKLTKVRPTSFTVLKGDNTGVDASGVPLLFHEGDEIYFTLTLGGYKVVNVGSGSTAAQDMPTPDDGSVALSSLSNYSKLNMYLKVKVTA